MDWPVWLFSPLFHHAHCSRNLRFGQLSKNPREEYETPLIHPCEPVIFFSSSSSFIFFWFLLRSFHGFINLIFDRNQLQQTLNEEWAPKKRECKVPVQQYSLRNPKRHKVVNLETGQEEQVKTCPGMMTTLRLELPEPTIMILYLSNQLVADLNSFPTSILHPTTRSQYSSFLPSSSLPSFSFLFFSFLFLFLFLFFSFFS